MPKIRPDRPPQKKKQKKNTSSNTIDKGVILGGKVDFSKFYQIFSYFL